MILFPPFHIHLKYSLRKHLAGNYKAHVDKGFRYQKALWGPLCCRSCGWLDLWAVAYDSLVLFFRRLTIALLLPKPVFVVSISSSLRPNNLRTCRWKGIFKTFFDSMIVWALSLSTRADRRWLQMLENEWLSRVYYCFYVIMTSCSLKVTHDSQHLECHFLHVER